MKDNKKIIIYQVLPRLAGNTNQTRKENGSLDDNGCGKLNFFSDRRLQQLRNFGVTHVWYTGVIRHATKTDYSAYGIPRQHPAVVKGNAGSPYAITDYYDIDPDLAEDVANRMGEWEALIERTHQNGLKVIMDFVPNHVARQYHSIAKPAGVRDLGEDDDLTQGFSPQNNFYYCVGQHFQPQFSLKGDAGEAYDEYPAKSTGNDRFDAYPGVNDWYETVKLNYGVDYYAGRVGHFDPIPSTWQKMTDILLFWAVKGVDGFRCDMAEMVPTAFWSYATKIVKERYPELVFIGEVYDQHQYQQFVKSGFDYLYDKVGMYDCLRDVVCGRRPASSITYEWQNNSAILPHMLYFLENHDEQRIASDFFCGDGNKAFPAAIVEVLLQRNPFMIYAGQELGEHGMDKEGFSGRDGRTTIFDYWAPDTLCRQALGMEYLSRDEKRLMLRYQYLFHIANREKAVRQGDFFDLMYVNPASYQFNPRTEYAFMRKCGDEVMLVVVNFSGETINTSVTIPGHAFDFFGLPEKHVDAVDLMTGNEQDFELKRDGQFQTELQPYSGSIFKFNVKIMKNDIILNDHNKDEFPPAHTAEHLLNQLMVRMFGCERSDNAHIERRKSKMTFTVDHKPTRQEEKEIERTMNELIQDDMPVTYEYVDRNNVPDDVHLDRLPGDASEMIRLVRIADYDVCPCIGKHVRSTAQIGRFVLLGTNWDEMTHSFRIRFKVIPA